MVRAQKDTVVRYRVHRAVKFFERFAKRSPDGSLKIRLVKMAPPSKNGGAHGATGARPKAVFDAELSAAVGDAAGDVDVQDITNVDDRIPTFSRDGSYIPGKKRNGGNGGGGGATSTPSKRKGDDITAAAADSKKADQRKKEGTEVCQETGKEDVNSILPTSSRNELYKELMHKFKSLADRHPEEREEINTMMSLVNGVLKETIKQATEESRKVVKKDLEYLRANKSVMLYNVNKLQLPRGDNYYAGAPVEEILTEELHNLTKHRVSIQEVVTFRRDENGIPTVAKVMLGSNRQRSILYRMLGAARQHAPESARIFRYVAFRDHFPMEYMEEVKKLVAEGMEIKKSGAAGSFRIVSQGDACIPVLQTRKAPGERWRVHVPDASKKGEAPNNRPNQNNLVESMEVTVINEARNSLVEEMPPAFRSSMVQDPDFSIKNQLVNALVMGGKRKQAELDWRAELEQMEKDISEFKGRREVKEKMKEIFDCYNFEFNNWLDSLL